MNISGHPPAAQPLLASALSPRLELELHQYETISLALDEATSACWCHLQPPGRASVTPAMLDDLGRMQATFRRMFDAAADGPAPFRFFVMASRVPGIFNLGGDLSLFADRIEARDRATLRRYGHTCVEQLYNNHTAYDAPVVSIALVQGDALGGGFECALSFDLIVAERSARFGFPEVLFNLFPGMGATSFLTRRIGPALARRMILDGSIHTAEELHALGIIDVLAEDGQGEAAVRALMARHGRRHNAAQAVFGAMRRVDPVALEELRAVVDMWVDAALNLDAADLRKMRRLAAAQERRCASSTPAPAAAQAAELRRAG